VKNGYSSQGGAVQITATAAILENCIFRDNYSADLAGAVHAEMSIIQVRGCLFQGNEAAARGGAFRMNSDWVEMEDCTFIDNVAGEAGGAIAVRQLSESWITGTTMVGNSAPEGSAFCMLSIYEALPLSRCILAGNAGGPAISCDEADSLAVDNVNIWNNTGGDWVGNIAPLLGTEFNISADPLFCGPDASNPILTLATDSPCLPENNPGGVLMGAHGWGCDRPVGVPAAGLATTLCVRPNPFNPTTTLSYSLTRAGAVELALYDPAGRLLTRLENGWRAAGNHTVAWNGTDDRGRSLGSGVYLAVLIADGRASTSKLALIR